MTRAPTIRTRTLTPTASAKTACSSANFSTSCHLRASSVLSPRPSQACSRACDSPALIYQYRPLVVHDFLGEMNEKSLYTLPQPASQPSPTPHGHAPPRHTTVNPTSPHAVAKIFKKYHVHCSAGKWEIKPHNDRQGHVGGLVFTILPAVSRTCWCGGGAALRIGCVPVMGAKGVTYQPSQPTPPLPPTTP